MTLLTLCLAASLQAAPAPQAAAPKKPARPTAALAGARGSCAQFPSNLCVPLDSSFTVVPFGAQFGISFGACERNDDGSALLALNGWSFDFYGTLWQDLWVNNNGNVSLGTQFAAFSSSGFPVSGFPMVAAFWGDVDTRAGDGTDGAVWYREWSTAAGDSVNRLVVTWDRVAFYDENTSKLNTFQIIITDGNDPLIGLGNNVCFCYDDMEWTTGDASSGSGGLGGTPATVGANQGNGTDFFLVGRFDADGDAYDGPAGANDGVDYLDGRTISFSVGGATTNVAPVYVSGDARYDVLVGDTLTFDVEAIGPEPSQSVTLTVDAGGLANFSSVETSGGLATSTATFTPDLSQLGTHVVEFTATDDGSPVATSLLTVEIVVAPAATVGDELCTPNGINSTGRAATLYAMGSADAAQNDLTLEVSDMPPNVLGLIAVSQSTGVLDQFMGNQGRFCINGADVGRYGSAIFNSTAAGRHTYALDLATLPTPTGVPAAAVAGQTWGWQIWYRDGAQGPNFTSAVRVTFL